MKINTNELIGPALDWAVTYALYGEQARYIYKHSRQRNSYSTCWAHGGPLIEGEKIDLEFMDNFEAWCGSVVREYGQDRESYSDDQDRESYTAEQESFVGYGPTPLIAVCRCYVASKMGDVVEVPEELT